MPGLEFRGSLNGAIPVPALDVSADAAYYAAAKPNDPVKIDGTGNVVRATVTDKVIYGVVAAREFQRATETPKIVKVRTSREAVYEVKVAAGTPVVGTAYELTAAGDLDATKVANASVKVQRLLQNLNPDGTYTTTALVTLV